MLLKVPYFDQIKISIFDLIFLKIYNLLKVVSTQFKLKTFINALNGYFGHMAYLLFLDE
jgi:hypothetical protein